jgi:hypothetical protein
MGIIMKVFTYMLYISWACLVFMKALHFCFSVAHLYTKVSCPENSFPSMKKKK